jgi:hypothetical protein
MPQDPQEAGSPFKRKLVLKRRVEPAEPPKKIGAPPKKEITPLEKTILAQSGGKVEVLLIAESIAAGRMKIENGNQPRRTRLSESDESEILIFAENIKLMLSTVGYTFLKKPTEYEDKQDVCPRQ